jgi:hypothetical protein
MTVINLLVFVGIIVAMAIFLLILVGGFENATRPIEKPINSKHYEYWMQLEDGTIVYPKIQKRQDVDVHI